MTPFSRIVIVAAAALGLAASSTSSYVHYKLLTDPGYSSFCDVNATVSCAQAYLSPYGSLWGVPVALAGVWFFVLILLLAGVGGRARSPVRESVSAYIFALSTVALAFVMYLGWASYVQLKTFCVLCAMTYAAVMTLFIVSGAATPFPMTTLPRRAPRDLRALVSSPAALVLALLLVAGAGSLIAYFPREAPAAAPAPASLVPLTDQQRADLEKWWVVQPTIDIAIPADGSTVTVVGFSDFQCPHCRSAHESYRSVIAKYAGNAQVRFLAKHFPLEGECNTNALNGSHLAACEAAAAVVMARATGRAAQMADWLYENQATLTPATVRQAAQSIGRIEDFNGGYAGALAEVKADSSLGGQLGVTSTPTFFINGHRLPPGVIPANYLDALIELELKRAK